MKNYITIVLLFGVIMACAQTQKQQQIIQLKQQYTQIQAKPADRFVDMMGACVHFARSSGAYTNSASNPNREQIAIGVATNIRLRHLRDGIYGWTGGTEDFDVKNRGVVTRFSDIHQAGIDAGIPGGLTWILTDNTDNWQRLRDSYLIPLGKKVIVLEGANENMGTSGDVQAYAQIRNWWNNILPSLPDLKIASNTGPTSACEIMQSGYIGDYVHFGNAHPYHFWPPFKPWGKTAHCNFNGTCAPPTISLWTAPDYNVGTVGYLEATRKQRVRSDQPMIFTEWGYPSPICTDNAWGVDDSIAAKYLLRGFLEHFNAGIVYSCTYELLDEEENSTKVEGNFGLADYNGNLKKNGLALKRMIELLEDNGNTGITTSALDFTLSGGGGLSFTDDHNATTNEIHQTLLQKSDSTYYLILWQEATSTNSGGRGINVPAVDVSINFNSSISHLKAFLPATTDNSKPVADTSNVTAITLKVFDHPLVIEIFEKPGAVPATGVLMIKKKAEIQIGESFQFEAKVSPDNASVNRVRWTSSNSSIASMGYNGLVTGLTAGNVIISAITYDGNQMITQSLTVKSVPVTDVSLTPVTDTISVLSTKQIMVNFIPENASNKNVRWSSENTTIAIVNENGLVTGVGAGSATITLITEDGGKTAGCRISVSKQQPSTWNIIDDKDTRWIWNGYTLDPCSSCYNGSSHSTNVGNASGQTKFTGTGVELYCETWDGGGKVEVFIDGVSKGLFSQTVKPFGGAMKFASIPGLTNEEHTIKIVSTSTEWTGIDYINYQSPFSPPVGFLKGEVALDTSSVNLSAKTDDWKHFNKNNHKANGLKINYISNYKLFGGSTSYYSDDLRSFSWFDGKPALSNISDRTGISATGIGNGFSFSSIANNDIDTLKIYVSGNNSGGTLIAQLANFADEDYVGSIETQPGKWDAVYTIIYNSKSNGEKVTITWLQSTGNGYIGLQAASISGTLNLSNNEELKNANPGFVTIYPNPLNNGSLTLEMNSIGNKIISIYTIEGQLIFSSQTSEQLIKIPHNVLKSGLYMVNVQSNLNVNNTKVIVN